MEAATTLFPEIGNEPAAESQPGTGLLPDRTLLEFTKRKIIWSPIGFAEDQIQPASIDLRLGQKAYRVRASFLPGRGNLVEARLQEFAEREFDIEEGMVLERGFVYVVPLLERLNLPKNYWGVANPKSSTGRIDVFTRLITNEGTSFDYVPHGYDGPLYAEISPLTFSIVVRKGSRLNQLRIRRLSARRHSTDIREAHRRYGLIGSDPDKVVEDASLEFGIDLLGRGMSGLIGYRAKKFAPLLDVDSVNRYDAREYWEAVQANSNRQLILDPDDFYILVSKEPVKVPPEYAAEMVDYDTQVGEFRVHYAGFFDPGFGYASNGSEVGSRAVLEVRSHKVPFILEDGQTVGRLIYEKLAQPPSGLYGGGIGSSYQGQGLALSKHFKRD